jgi:probable HAF family extracellular repeat protein
MIRREFLMAFLISIFVSGTLLAEVRIIDFIEISLPSPQHTFGYGLNNEGQVVGLVKDGFINYPFVWDEASGLNIIDLPYEASAGDINDHGTVVGSAIIKNSSTSYSYSPYRVTSDGDSFFLGFSAESASAAGINSTGNIVGYYDSIGAFLWAATGGIHFLDLGSGMSGADDINDRNKIVGYYEKDISGTSIYMAFLLTGLEGDVIDLGSLGSDTNSYAKALNEISCVTGYAENDANEYHAFLWMVGKMYDLGTLGGSYSEAKGINNSNIVVGYSRDVNDHRHAFVWDPKHKMIDLNDLMPDDTQIDLFSAFAINQYNEVVGFGLKNGRYRAFLMKLDGLVSSIADLDIDSDIDGRDLSIYLDALAGGYDIISLELFASDFGKNL